MYYTGGYIPPQSTLKNGYRGLTAAVAAFKTNDETQQIKYGIGTPSVSFDDTWVGEGAWVLFSLV